jgi:hypothetical protein
MMQRLVFALLALAICVQPALAQRRGGGMRGGGSRGGGFRGGGGGFARASARPSVSRAGGFGGGGFNRPSAPVRQISNPGRAINNGNVVRNGNAVRNSNVVRNGNINRNRPINNYDVNVGGDWDDRWDGCCYRPLAGAAAVATGAALATAAIGSTVYALPSSCSTTVVNGVTYENCNGVWYQPQFSGTETTYVVVNQP